MTVMLQVTLACALVHSCHVSYTSMNGCSITLYETQPANLYPPAHLYLDVLAT